MKQLYSQYGGHYKETSLENVLGNIGNGWHALVTKLMEDLFERGWDGYIDQVKEKFGGLRFYIPYNQHDEWQHLINRAEIHSFTVCEDCGLEGKRENGGGWWIRTLCPTHAAEHLLKQKEITRKREAMKNL